MSEPDEELNAIFDEACEVDESEMPIFDRDSPVFVSSKSSVSALECNSLSNCDNVGSRNDTLIDRPPTFEISMNRIGIARSSCEKGGLRGGQLVKNDGNNDRGNMWDRHASTSSRMLQYHQRGQIQAAPAARQMKCTRPPHVLARAQSLPSIVSTLKLGVGGVGGEGEHGQRVTMKHRKGARGSFHEKPNKKK